MSLVPTKSNSCRLCLQREQHNVLDISFWAKCWLMVIRSCLRAPYWSVSPLLSVHLTTGTLSNMMELCVTVSSPWRSPGTMGWKLWILIQLKISKSRRTSKKLKRINFTHKVSSTSSAKMIWLRSSKVQHTTELQEVRHCKTEALHNFDLVAKKPRGTWAWLLFTISQ